MQAPRPVRQSAYHHRRIGLIIYFGQVTHQPMKSGLPCAIIVFAVVSLERFSPKSGLMHKLGDWSYSTYLGHVLLMCLMMKVQQLFDLSHISTFVLTVMGIMAMSYASFKWIEKPFSNLAKKNFKSLPLLPEQDRDVPGSASWLPPRDITGAAWRCPPWQCA